MNPSQLSRNATQVIAADSAFADFPVTVIW